MITNGLLGLGNEEMARKLVTVASRKVSRTPSEWGWPLKVQEQG